MVNHDQSFFAAIIVGQVDGRTQMDKLTEEWMDRRTDGHTDRQTVGRTGGPTDGWMD